MVNNYGQPLTTHTLNVLKFDYSYKLKHSNGNQLQALVHVSLNLLHARQHSQADI